MTMAMYVFVGTLGLLTGSFLNVVINRLYKKQDIIKKRSHCPKCGAVLKWYELIPVFSFIIQRGKCRACRQPISFQYPIVEIATSILFLFVVTNFQLFPAVESSTFIAGQTVISEFSALQLLQVIFLWITFSGLLVIFAYDIKHYIIPDIVLFPLIGLVFLARLIGIWSLDSLNLFGNWTLKIVPTLSRTLDIIGGNSVSLTSFFLAITAGLFASLFFFIIYAISKGRAMGFGDVKLAFFMGLLLGFQEVILAIFLAFIFGGIVGSILIVLKKKKLKSQMPFGPFLVLGTFIALFFGGNLINWYSSLFL